MGLLGGVRNVVRVIRGDDYARYMLAERVARRTHPDAILPDRDLYWLQDTEFRAIYDRLRPGNRRSMGRVWTLREFARRAATLDGETAECGVFTGLSSYIIASASDNPHHAFDSFEGLSAPGPDDGAWSEGDLSVSLTAVKANLGDLANIHYYQGWIPDRFNEVADRSFSLVHIDVDLAEPTKASLDFFGPRMVPGGVVVLDDYGFESCPGARSAINRFAEDRGVSVLELPTGQGVIIDF